VSYRYAGDGRGTLRGRSLVTKPGKFGTLYLYRVEYRGAERDPAAPELHVNVWAYDPEHATEKVADEDQGWEVLSTRRLYE
jgi:hypothetical protein